jgi:oligosaccharide repeat unit polymerase
MLRQFIFVWTFYWIAVAVLPVHSLYPSTTEALMLEIAFVAIVSLSAKIVLDVFHIRQMPAADENNVPRSATLIWIAIFLSVVGLAALTYDKIFIQGIDYSSGLAFAREEWRELGEERDGQASSVFSVVGYLLGSSYYVAAILAITQGAVLSARMRLMSLLASFLLLMANSVLTGGRSNVLLLAVFVAAAFKSRRGITVRGLFKSRTQRRVLFSLVALAFAYSLFIFFQRAGTNGSTGVEYAIDFLPYLGVEADSWYRQSLNASALSGISAVTVLAGSYITHSFSSVAAIIDAPTEDKTLLFLNVMQMLYKLGFVTQPDGNWFLAGRSSSVPGALWHQFGPIGFFAGSVFLGCTAAATKIWLVRWPGNIVALGAYTMATTTLLLTPVVFAPDFLSFPFVLASFVILAISGQFLCDLKFARLRHLRPPNGKAARGKIDAAFT